jgi:protein phosphatase
MFDIIGDPHGCATELIELLVKLGYQSDDNSYVHPDGRIAVFAGDLVSRGWHSVQVLWLVRDMIRKGNALSVIGNHCDKVMRFCLGRSVKLAHGDDGTARQIESLKADKQDIAKFFASLPYYLLLDDGKLAVVHASWRDSMAKHDSFDKKLRSDAIYGPTTGKVLEDGMPDRIDWAAARVVTTDSPFVVYGHQPHREPRFINDTCDVDTACVFGGHLTAFRWPEREIVQVRAHQAYDLSKPEMLEMLK